MAKSSRIKQAPHRPAVTPPAAFSPEAQEIRALLRRVPDGTRATLSVLAARPQECRERIMGELARGLGRDFLPLLRSAALGSHTGLAHSALRILPRLGTRAAADTLIEVLKASPDAERVQLAQSGAAALAAQGIRVDLPELDQIPEDNRLQVREAFVTSPDRVGSRSVGLRLQDRYGVWHVVFVLWHDQAGVKDGFTRTMSQHEWRERRQEISADGEILQAACPHDYARWMVEQARRINERTGFPLGDSLHDWDRLVGPVPVDYLPPEPLEWLPPPDSPERARLVQASGSLHMTPGRLLWSVDPMELVARFSAWESIVYVRDGDTKSRGERDAERDRLCAELVGEHLQGEQLELFKERLREHSRVLHWLRHEEPAMQAAAVAAAIEEKQDPQTIPFCLQLIENAFIAIYVCRSQGEDLDRLRYDPMRKY